MHRDVLNGPTPATNRSHNTSQLTAVLSICNESTPALLALTPRNTNADRPLLSR
jgi:hypothetical protein